MLRFPQATSDSVRLAVVLPALDEAEAVGFVVAAIPRRIAGVAAVRVVVVDDGSSDATGHAAAAAGADAIVRHARNRGLAAAFNNGIREALAAGADLVVTMDADGQHDPAAIPRLVAPLLAGAADLVVAVRPLTDASQGSRSRRLGNRLGSAILRRSVPLAVSDFTSGYRAFTREALLQLNVVTDYTYTLETLIQAARKRLAVAQVVVPARKRVAGQSRMTRSLYGYISQSGVQAFRTMLHQNPLGVLGRAAMTFALGSVACGLWFFIRYGDGGMHLPALLTSLVCALASMALFITALIADGTNENRRLLEDALYRIKRMEAEQLPAAAVDEPSWVDERQMVHGATG